MNFINHQLSVPIVHVYRRLQDEQTTHQAEDQTFSMDIRSAEGNMLAIRDQAEYDVRFLGCMGR